MRDFKMCQKDMNNMVRLVYFLIFLSIPIAVLGIAEEGKSNYVISYLFMVLLCFASGLLYIKTKRKNSFILLLLFIYCLALRTGFAFYLKGNLSDMNKYSFTIMVCAALLFIVPISIYVLLVNRTELKRFIRYFFSGRWD